MRVVARDEAAIPDTAQQASPQEERPKACLGAEGEGLGQHAGPVDYEIEGVQAEPSGAEGAEILGRPGRMPYQCPG